MKVVCMQKLFRIFAHLFVFWDMVSLCNLDRPKTHYVNDALELKEIYVPLTLEFWDYQCHSNYLVVKLFKLRLTTKKKKCKETNDVCWLHQHTWFILLKFSWLWACKTPFRKFYIHKIYTFSMYSFSTVPLKTYIV